MQVRQYESNLLEALNRIPPSMRAGNGLGHQMRHDPTAYDGVHPVSRLSPAGAVCAFAPAALSRIAEAEVFIFALLSSHTFPIFPGRPDRARSVRHQSLLLETGARRSQHQRDGKY